MQINDHRENHEPETSVAIPDAGMTASPRWLIPNPLWVIEKCSLVYWSLVGLWVRHFVSELARRAPVTDIYGIARGIGWGDNAAMGTLVLGIGLFFYGFVGWSGDANWPLCARGLFIDVMNLYQRIAARKYINATDDPEEKS